MRALDARRAAGGLAGLAASLLAVGCVAESRDFSFRKVEFMRDDQREPAARQFVAEAVKPGMPTAGALAALRKAGLHCRSKAQAAYTTECATSSFEHKPDETLAEVWWTVDVVSSPSDAVVSATVERSRYGG